MGGFGAQPAAEPAGPGGKRFTRHPAEVAPQLRVGHRHHRQVNDQAREEPEREALILAGIMPGPAQGADDQPDEIATEERRQPWQRDDPGQRPEPPPGSGVAC